MVSIVKDANPASAQKSASLNAAMDDLASARFSPARNAISIQKELLKRGPDGHFIGGIVHEAVRGPGGKIINLVHIANPYQKEPLDVVTLPTRCTKQEIERIRANIIPMKETYEILSALATAYQQRHPILIEGDTSIGKTFVVNRFMEILYGKGARPIDFYCSGQTDVSELLGKWAPKTSGLKDSERKLLDEFLQTDYGKKKIGAIRDELQEAKTLSQDSQRALVQSKLSSLLEGVGLNKSVQWEFSYGAVPKAMMCAIEPGGKTVLPDNGGAGTILKVDEVGLAEPAVTMALLRIRGEAGRVTDSVQLWEAGGEIVRAGPDFFIVYTTNPSDKDYVQRNEIDPALARSVVWVRKGTLSEESLALAAQKYLSFEIGNDPGQKPLRCVVDLRIEKELARELSEVAALVHRRYLEVTKNGEPGRKQKLPGSLDHIARLASYLLTNQVVDPKSGVPDFCETLRRGVEFHYLSGLVDQKMKDTITKELDMLLTADTVGKKTFRGKEKIREKIFETLAGEAIEKNATAASTKSVHATGDLSGQDRQVLNDVSDSVLAQLDKTRLSLQDDIFPQINSALDMITDRAVKEDLVREITERDKPKGRTAKDWDAFKNALNKLLACSFNVSDERLAA